jgi:hypothetical protein
MLVLRLVYLILLYLLITDKQVYLYHATICYITHLLYILFIPSCFFSTNKMVLLFFFPWIMYLFTVLSVFNLENTMCTFNF